MEVAQRQTALTRTLDRLHHLDSVHGALGLAFLRRQLLVGRLTSLYQKLLLQDSVAFFTLDVVRDKKTQTITAA